MNTVHILFHQEPWQNETLLGIYSSKEIAEVAREEYIRDEDGIAEYLKIAEVPVNTSPKWDYKVGLAA